MRKLFLIWLYIAVQSSFAQNLIPNPDFERYEKCPDASTGYDWNIPPTCWTNPLVQYQYTPDTYVKGCKLDDRYDCLTKYAHARSGKVSVGITVKGYETDYREYLQIRLLKPLKAHHEYWGTFFVRTYDFYNVYVWDYGMYFSPIPPTPYPFKEEGYSRPDRAIYEQNPQIRNKKDNFIDDRDQAWVKISGKFIAKGNEQYMTVGCFSPLNQVESTSRGRPVDFCGGRPTNYNYVYLDDFSLYNCTQLTDYEYFTLECQPEVRLTPQIEGANFRWSDGSTDAQKTFTKAGKYWLETRLEDCFTRDTFEIFDRLPEVKIDTVLCEGTPLVLDWAEVPTDKPLTEPCGTQIPMISAAGEFKMDLKQQGCTVKHQIKIRYEKMPEISLKSDTTLCTGEVLHLQVPEKQGVSYQWSNGIKGSSTQIRETGTYSLITQTKFCYRVDQIKATFYDCLDFLPNVITPNGDGKNDRFEIRAIQKDVWHLLIYNRWGEKVYENADYKNDWEASGLSGGLYYYQLTNSHNQKTYKGWVQVLK